MDEIQVQHYILSALGLSSSLQIWLFSTNLFVFDSIIPEFQNQLWKPFPIISYFTEIVNGNNPKSTMGFHGFQKIAILKKMPWAKWIQMVSHVLSQGFLAALAALKVHLTSSRLLAF